MHIKCGSPYNPGEGLLLHGAGSSMPGVSACSLLISNLSERLHVRQCHCRAYERHAWASHSACGHQVLTYGRCVNPDVHPGYIHLRWLVGSLESTRLPPAHASSFVGWLWELAIGFSGQCSPCPRAQTTEHVDRALSKFTQISAAGLEGWSAHGPLKCVSFQVHETVLREGSFWL